MKKPVELVSILAATILVGCAVAKEWSATGGSRSDGMVKLSYEIKEFEKPILDEQQGINLATQRCRAWGYSGAESFGGVTRQCNRDNGAGCSQWLVTKEYQCTGTLKN
jgi:YecR-like lipoprotein